MRWWSIWRRGAWWWCWRQSICAWPCEGWKSPAAGRSALRWEALLRRNPCCRRNFSGCCRYRAQTQAGLPNEARSLPAFWFRMRKKQGKEGRSVGRAGSCGSGRAPGRKKRLWGLETGSFRQRGILTWWVSWMWRRILSRMEESGMIETGRCGMWRRCWRREPISLMWAVNPPGRAIPCCRKRRRPPG